MADARTVKLRTGTEMSYAESGDPAGLPVLCLHGYGDSWRSFELMMKAMPPHLRMISISHRGHGDSSCPEDGFTPKDFATDAVALLDALGIDKAVVVGHSMGSFIAQRLTLDAPERVLALVLVGSFATLKGHEAVDEIWEGVVQHLTDPVDADFVREFQTGTMAMPVDPAFIEVILEESMKIPAKVWRAAMRGMMDADHRDELAGIKVPTLIIWGDQDQLFALEHEEALTGAMPSARFVAWEGVGHGVQWEVPERIASEVAGFIEREVARPA